MSLVASQQVVVRGMSMVTQAQLYTAEDLAAMSTNQPWELWHGELRRVPGAGGAASGLAHVIGWFITSFVLPRRLGWVTGADGAFILQRDPDVVVMPDIGYVSWETLGRRTPPSTFIPIRPDFAVEVASPTDRKRDIDEKLELYRAAAVPLIWWVFPNERTVAVYRRGTLVASLGMDGILDGDDVLPGFSLPVAEIFAVL